MVEEVCTDDRTLDVSNDETPVKLASEAEVKCEGSSTIYGYRGVIYSLKTEVLAMRAVCMRRGNDADICTRVNEETSTRGLVRDEE